ncbi:MAG TPA: hypothetical protein VJ890_16605 [Vineibacter sp.]|nr:hypothetical protein [Vineibacter sp.]
MSVSQIDTNLGRSHRVLHPGAAADFGFLAALVAILAVALSLAGGATGGAFNGLLIDTDSYTRVSRILASIEAGTILDHVPRDNAGVPIALHWSHLLDAILLLLALPLWPLLGAPDALRLAGAALGPLTAAGAALAAMYAARVLGAATISAFTAGVVAALSHSIMNYGALGRADHHVLLGALGLLAPVLAYADRTAGFARPAAWGGVASGLGLWLSPEMLPFALLAWAVAIIRDTEADGRFGRRATQYCAALLAVLLLATVIDPPSSGRWAVELDRLSRPFLELAALMTAVTLLARLLPTMPVGWPTAIGAGCVALLAIVPWVVMYPAMLHGAEGVFSPEGWTRIWRFNNEMRTPLRAANDIAVSMAVPTAVLGLAAALLLWRRRRPIDVLAVAGACLVAYLACRYIRLTIYLQLAAAVAAGLVLQHLTGRLAESVRRLTTISAAFCLALAPFIGGALFRPTGDLDDGGSACDARAVAADLAPFSGKVVLTWLNDAPTVLFFSKVTVAAAPYHRAERRIFDVIDIFTATSFADAPPEALGRTGATAVLVCSIQSFRPGSLGEALAKGQPPAWLAERPVGTASRYRLYVVR